LTSVVIPSPNPGYNIACLSEFNPNGTVTQDGTSGSATTATGSSAPTGTATVSAGATDGVFALVTSQYSWGTTLSSPTGGFSQASQGSNGSHGAGVGNVLALLYLLNPSSGPHSSSMTVSPADQTQGIIAAFSAGASSPGGTLTARSRSATMIFGGTVSVLIYPSYYAAKPATLQLRAADETAAITLKARPASLSIECLTTTTLSVLATGTWQASRVQVSAAATTSFPGTLTAAARRAKLVVAAGIPPVPVITLVARHASFNAAAVQSFNPNLYLAAQQASLSFSVAQASGASFTLHAQPASILLGGQSRLGPLELHARPASLSFSVVATASGTLTLRAQPAVLRFTIQGNTGSTGPYVYHVYANNGNAGPVDFSNPVFITPGLSYTPPPLATPSDTTWVVHTYDPVTQLEDNAPDTVVRLILNDAAQDTTTLPNAPRALTATPKPGGTALVSWSYFRNKNTAQASGFNVYVGPWPTPNYLNPAAVVPASVNLNLYSGTIGGLVDTRLYAVGVRSYNANGEEGNINVVKVVGVNEVPEQIVMVAVNLETGT
jgi:hypothetical protein